MNERVKCCNKEQLSKRVIVSNYKLLLKERFKCSVKKYFLLKK